jgi:hypothetical protein
MEIKRIETIKGGKHWIFEKISEIDKILAK